MDSFETSAPDPDPYQLSLYTIPRNVYKVPDPGHEATESWFFDLVLREESGLPATPVSLMLDLYAGEEHVKRTLLSRIAFEPIQDVRHKVGADDGPASHKHHANLNELFDVRLKFSEQVSLDVDLVVCELELELPDGSRDVESLEVPVSRYEQQVELILPLKTPCVVLRGQVHNGGHHEWSTQFALDLIGLDERYAMLRYVTDTNESFIGWGQEVIAPAGGVVTYARNDVPDQPHPHAVDESTFRDLPEPVWASAGNTVVIDHGTGEYSVLCHMQQGSVRVNKGDRVAQGQVIGRLGNSGHSFGPHLHYHLQAGEVIFGCDPLPVRFGNIGTAELSRGTYVTPESAG
ncbi:MAG: M23 family metallopeptidase [Chloroflexota bacterium]|nr:M23 family metallopeptidase [Chloroflexota bacterium]